ncbi:hypothetical protein ACEWY4_003435 [Coilia grayii]|uniref:Uncharacterized protein n=1 Tax=Coilia grayii TaxID=363190 RepID=A0ABD1KR95_9TELE
MRSEIKILLCGGTGVGKSAVGNTIVGTKKFLCGTRPHPVTLVCETASTIIRGRTITVVDTPSTEEPGLEAEFQRCVNSQSPPDIFLLVTPLGYHGDKALRVLNTLQTVFQGHAVDNFTIVLFTGGDRREEISKSQINQEKNTELHELLTRCGNRQHTFNNEDNDQTQVLQLLATINRLLHKNRTGLSSYNGCNVNARKRNVEETQEVNDIWNWAEYSTHLPVVCGDLAGMLHRDKMAKGENCIEMNGKWYTPSKFEVLGGKGHFKKWKKSIRCQNVTLHQLIEDGHLKCPNFQKKDLDGEQSEFPMWAPDGSLIESADYQVILTGSKGNEMLTDKLLGENATVDDVKMAELQETSLTVTCKKVVETPQKNRSAFSESLRDSKVKGKIKKESASQTNKSRISPRQKELRKENTVQDDLDMAIFQESLLPVTCKKAEGSLQKNRFSSGSMGKCIRTAGHWMTPEEFVQEEAGLKDGKWRRDIKCHGQPLAILIEKNILQLHSLLCECGVCKSEDPSDQNNDDLCFICCQDTELVCCDGCPRSFHHACHLPPLGQNLGDRWMCTFCIVEKSKELCHRTMTLKEAMNSAILPNMLQCQYLLLYLLKEDKDLIFMQDPCLTLANYAAVISKPMWIDKIIQKLRGEYSTVGQFVADVRLIFRNCTAYNKNNEYGKMGARLSGLFEKKLKSVFSIT